LRGSFLWIINLHTLWSTQKLSAINHLYWNSTINTHLFVSCIRPYMVRK